MRRVVFIFIIIISYNYALCKTPYLSSDFLKDKNNLEKQIQTLYKKNGLLKKHGPCKVKYIYTFTFAPTIDSLKYNLIAKNRFLEDIVPIYKYYFYPFHLVKGKDLTAEIYVFDKKDNFIIGAISSSGFPLKLNINIQDYSFKTKLAVFKLDCKFSMFFYIGINSLNDIWCVNDDETFIYNFENKKLITLKKYYDLFFRNVNPNDIFHISHWRGSVTRANTERR